MKSLSAAAPQKSPPRTETPNPALGTSNTERLEALRDTLAALGDLGTASAASMPWSGWFSPGTTAEDGSVTLTAEIEEEELRARLDAHLASAEAAEGDRYTDEATRTERELLASARGHLDALSEDEQGALDGAGLHDTDTLSGSLTGLDGDGPVKLGGEHQRSRPRITDDGALVRDQATTSGSVSIGGGLGGDLSHTSGPKDGDQSTSSVGGGFIATEKGERGAALRGSRGSTLADGSGATASGSAQLTNRGYRASGNLALTGAEHEGTSGDLKATIQTQAWILPSGHVLVYIEEIPDTDPVAYHLVADVQLKLGGSVGGKAGGEAGNAGVEASVSGKVGGSLSGQLTYKHILSAEQVAQYRTDLDAAAAGSSSSSSDKAEFGLISAVSMLGGEVLDEDGLQLLAAHSPEAAAKLDIGESVQTTLTAELSAAGSAELDLFSVEGKGSETWSRTFSASKVAGPDGSPRIALSIGFASASARDGSGEVGEGLLTQLTREHSDSRSDTRTFHLDPEASDYDATYRSLMSIRSRAALAAATTDPETAPYLHQTVLAGAEHDVLGAGITTDELELPGGKLGKIPLLGREDTADMSEKITATRGEGMAYVGSASSESERDRLGSIDEAEKIAVTADDEQLQVSMSQEETRGQSWWLGLWQRITGTGPDDAPQPDAMQAIIDPQQALQDALGDEHAVLTTWSLSSGDVEALIGRAQDRARWDAAAAAYPKAFLGWQGLRRQLAAPIPAADPELACIDAAGRARIAQGRALIGFVQHGGGDGIDILENALRHWGEGALVDSGERSEDLGSMQEWPPSLREQMPLHASVFKRGDAIIAAGDGFDASEIGPVLQDLEGLIDAVDAASDFTAPRVQLEMSGALRTLRAALTSRLMSCDLDLDDAGAARDLLHLDAMNHIGEHEEELPLYKAQEQRLLEAAASIDPRGNQQRVNDLGSTLTRVSDLHELWISRVQSLRSWYQTAEERMIARAVAEGAEGIPAPGRRWLVSEGPGLARNPETEPDGARYTAELERFQGMHASADALEIGRRRYADY